jgi:hypothetical protein
MKLVLLFMMMDLLTLLVYPFVFMHGKLYQLAKSRVSIDQRNTFVTGSVTPDR